jgi:rod shape-determining protein MreB
MVGRGVLVDRPSRVERRAPTAGALALEASPLWPVAGGVIVDGEGASRLLAPLIRQARETAPAKPWILVCHPSDATAAERSTLVEAARHAGAGAVRLVPEPLAAALGIGLDVCPQYAHLILDIGDGVADAAVFHSGELTASRALRAGCGELRALLRQTIQAEHGTSLHDDEIHCLLRAPASDEDWIAVQRTRSSRRRHGQQRRVVWSGVFVRAAAVTRAVEAFASQLATLVEDLLRVAGVGPPGAARGGGLWLTGGGALFPQLVRSLSACLGLQARTPPDPLHAVISGAVRLLTAFDADGPTAWAQGRP